MEPKCVDTTKIYLRQINKNVAKDMIIANHYSHKWSICRVAYGIFYKNNEENPFFDDNSDKLIGCIVYAQPVGRSAAASLSELLKINEVMELVRLWIKDGEDYGKNLESYCIAQSFKMLNRDFPEIKAVISYADGEVGHKGTIYQATGFLYQGNSSVALMPNHSISLTGPPNYKWMHSRTVSSTFGSHNLEHLKRVIGKTFWRKKESSKHRYIIFICKKPIKKKLIASLKHPILPYPKSTEHKDEIQEIVVENKPDNSFFA